jgi:hypothetical protein
MLLDWGTNFESHYPGKSFVPVAEDFLLATGIVAEGEPQATQKS